MHILCSCGTTGFSAIISEEPYQASWEGMTLAVNPSGLCHHCMVLLGNDHVQWVPAICCMQADGHGMQMTRGPGNCVRHSPGIAPCRQSSIWLPCKFESSCGGAVFPERS